MKKWLHIVTPVLCLLELSVSAQRQESDSARESVRRDTAVPATRTLGTVTVTGRVPTVEHKQGKSIIHVDASIGNVGSTVLEVLERSPGVMVDRNGGISLYGKPGVLVLIDDKPTYLSGEDLNNLLSSMSSSQVSEIELMANPPAKYDASGNAGVINIRTKKNKNQGFNGSWTSSYGQGIYPKNTNSLVMNFRKGKVSSYLNYTLNAVRYLTDLYAWRTYYDDNRAPTAILEQSADIGGTVVNNTLKIGMDYSLRPGTTVGIGLTGMSIPRHGTNISTANWMKPGGAIDSSILTRSVPHNIFRNGGVNLNGRQVLSKGSDISADLDYLYYHMQGRQEFENDLQAPGGYSEIYRNDIPTNIRIVTGKMDYSTKAGHDAGFQAGWKVSSSHTDNTATYRNRVSQDWVIDNTRSNHFVYQESIAAGYASFDKKFSRVELQVGLRYEHTSYDAHQFGNAQQKDSSVSRNYGSIFPNGTVTYKVDSLHSFSLTASRRIDRPVFQTLNPFVYVINKYTYETGNPYILPQYSWNFELSHQYKELLTSTVSYTYTTDYFSQIFLSDTSKTILYYTQGNVGHVYNLGLSASLNFSPVHWWSLNFTAQFNHKQLRGFNGNSYTSEISQLNMNMNNQFSLGKGYAAELSGVYTTRARNDVQELLYPTGQASAGLSKRVMKKKGVLKLSYRDIFYTYAMEGLTSFPSATEYFKLKRDSRVLTLSFTYRFGKSFKVERRQDGAAEEKDRVQNG